MFSIELQQIRSSLTIKLVDVAFLIVVSEVDDRHNAGIPENWTFVEVTLLCLSVSTRNFLLREQPVEVDIKTEAGGDIVWDAAPDLEVHLTILRDPPGQANIEISSS